MKTVIIALFILSFNIVYSKEAEVDQFLKAEKGRLSEFATNSNEPIPFAVFHGLSETCGWRQNLADYISKETGQTGICIETGGGNEDYFTSIKSQAEKGCKALQENAVFKSAKYYDIIGLSQGGLIARYIIEECDLNAKPRRFFSIGGPQMGVAKIPSCPEGAKCDIANYLVKTVIYSSLVQNWIGPAGYFKVPSKYEEYKKNSVFLPILNNERTTGKSEIYKSKFKVLDLVVLIKFDRDTTIVPKESEWFQFYDKEGKLQNMEDTELYKNDLIGLKDLNERGKVIKFSIDGDHLHYTDTDIDNYVVKYLK